MFRTSFSMSSILILFLALASAQAVQTKFNISISKNVDYEPDPHYRVVGNAVVLIWPYDFTFKNVTVTSYSLSTGTKLWTTTDVSWSESMYGFPIEADTLAGLVFYYNKNHEVVGVDAATGSVKFTVGSKPCTDPSLQRCLFALNADAAMIAVFNNFVLEMYYYGGGTVQPKLTWSAKPDVGGSTATLSLSVGSSITVMASANAQRTTTAYTSATGREVFSFPNSSYAISPNFANRGNTVVLNGFYFAAVVNAEGHVLSHITFSNDYIQEAYLSEDQSTVLGVVLDEDFSRRQSPAHRMLRRPPPIMAQQRSTKRLKNNYPGFVFASSAATGVQKWVWNTDDTITNLFVSSTYVAFGTTGSLNALLLDGTTMFTQDQGIAYMQMGAPWVGSHVMCYSLFYYSQTSSGRTYNLIGIEDSSF